MTRARDKHRPLRSGLRIESWAGTRYVPRYVEAGTLRVSRPATRTAGAFS